MFKKKMYQLLKFKANFNILFYTFYCFITCDPFFLLYL